MSRIDLFNIGRRYVITRAVRINPREIDVEGSDINLFVGAAAFMANAVGRQNIERINALLLDGARRAARSPRRYERLHQRHDHGCGRELYPLCTL